MPPALHTAGMSTCTPSAVQADIISVVKKAEAEKAEKAAEDLPAACSVFPKDVSTCGRDGSVVAKMNPT